MKYPVRGRDSCPWTELYYGIIKSVSISDGVASICADAFYHCSSLTSVSIPESVTAPTCTEAGYTTYTCSRCGDTYTGDAKDALGHDWSEWIAMKDPSLEEDGEEMRVCSRDRSHIEKRAIPALVNDFSDVPEGDWFEEAALWCNYKGYITGTGEGVFDPNVPLTRAMFVQILARVAGAKLDEITYGGKFEDVRESDWFAKAVQWAVDNGVTSGTSETTFEPNAPVTREQLAVFFFAYAGSRGWNTSLSIKLTYYTDKFEISDWAHDAVCWAVAEELMTGMTERTIGPKDSAARAQAAVIFRKFVQNIVVTKGDWRMGGYTVLYSDGSVEYYYVSEFDENGNRISEKWTSADGESIGTYQYEYDENGNVSAEIYASADGNVSYRKTHKWEYYVNAEKTERT